MFCHKVCAENEEELTLFWFSKLRYKVHKKVIYQVMIEFHISKERCLMNHISYAQFVTTACRGNQVWVLKGVNTVFHSNYYLL